MHEGNIARVVKICATSRLPHLLYCHPFTALKHHQSCSSSAKAASFFFFGLSTSDYVRSGIPEVWNLTCLLQGCLRGNAPLRDKWSI